MDGNASLSFARRMTWPLLMSICGFVDFITAGDLPFAPISIHPVA
jgi:hypothetical protein